MKFILLRQACLAFSLTSVVLVAQAAYPEKPITLVVPFPAGGATDAMARLTAERLGRELGQTIIVDNRGGAGGAIAAEAALHGGRDGYTLFFATTGTMAINPYIYKRLKYDPLKDFAPVGSVASTTNVLVVAPSVKAANVPDLITLIRANPGKFNYGSSGVGSSSHLAGALFAQMNKLDMVHVPYKGSAPALNDFLGGRIDMMFDTASTHAANVRAGKVRALAVTSAQPSVIFPGTPTLAQTGMKGFDVTIWYGLAAPAGTPEAVLDKLSAALSAVLRGPDIKNALTLLGADPMPRSRADFSAFIRQENMHWQSTVAQVGSITLD